MNSKKYFFISNKNIMKTKRGANYILLYAISVYKTPLVHYGVNPS